MAFKMFKMFGPIDQFDQKHKTRFVFSNKNITEDKQHYTKRHPKALYMYVI